MEKLGNIMLYNADCMEIMKGFLDNQFDLAIVDPPYGINASNKIQYHKDSFTKYIPQKWDNKIPEKKYFDELFRVSKEQIIFGANYFVEFLPAVKNWIVWDKLQPEGISLSMHELAFYSGNGQAKIYRGYNGANRCAIKELSKKYTRIHPTQKPVELYKWILLNYTEYGDKILDTHLGSGSICIAAHDLGFELTGIEIDEQYYNDAKKRLIEHQRQLKIFE